MLLMVRRCLLLAWAAVVLSGLGCQQPTMAENRPAAAAEKRADGGAAIRKVNVVSPQRKPLVRSTTQPARIEALEETPIHVKLDAFVEQIKVDIGDRVEANQVLAELRIPELKEEQRQHQALVAQAEAEVQEAAAAVRAAEAMLASAQAGVALAEAGIVRASAEHERWQAEYTRIAELGAGGSITRKVVDETQSQLRAADAARQEAAAQATAAQASVAQAQANAEKTQADQTTAAAHLRVAEANLARVDALLSYATVRAPFPGVVTDRRVHTGHFVRPGSGNSPPLFVVSRNDVVRVFADVPETEAALVDRDDPAVVRLPALGGLEIAGKVTRTAWALDATTRTLRTEIDLPNSEGQLRPGMYATVQLTLTEIPETLVVPAAAVIREAGETFCWAVEQGHVVRQPVVTGLRSGDEIEIKSGLSGGEFIVRDGAAAALSAGQAVEAIKPQ